MQASGLTLNRAGSFPRPISRRLQRRRSGGRLAPFESDRCYRLARIVALAQEFFGSHERAVHWLKHPNRALGSVAPSPRWTLKLGARQVENVLGRIGVRRFGELKQIYRVLRAPPTLTPKSLPTVKELPHYGGRNTAVGTRPLLRTSDTRYWPCSSTSSIWTRTIHRTTWSWSRGSADLLSRLQVEAQRSTENWRETPALPS